VVSADQIVRVADNSCSIALTKRNLLDLYRAVPHKCGTSALGRVKAWRSHDDEIDLIEQGGRPAGKLIRTGEGTYDGETLDRARLRISP